MPRAIETKWDVGADRYGRRLTLIRDESGSQPVYRLHREAYSQQDETVTFYDLPIETIREMARCVEGQR